MKFLSLSNAIKLMVAIGLIAIFALIVQSCQPSKSTSSSEQKALQSYAVKSLSKLYVLQNPPPQPVLSFKTVDGQSQKLSDLRGQYVLMNAWATWCAPCVQEMPSLDRLAAQTNNADFQIITISLDKDASDIPPFFEKYGLKNLTDWHDGSLSLGAKLGARGLPVTILYNRNGQEIARLEGTADWSSPEALALIDRLTE
ncbi:MAG: TlpA family protein disulfide reductase [Hellea sp.]|nr:TlpA family protein disulfide reductase [Hellea sp.]